MEGCPGNKRVREDGGEEREAKRLHADFFFGFLEDDDIGFGSGEREPASHELETVMKSLEEEIRHQPAMGKGTVEGRRMDIGYLLEASDDELGLPPQGKASVEGEVEPPEEFEQIWGLEEDGMPAWYEGFSEFGNFSENFVMTEEGIGGASVAASLDDGISDLSEFFLRPVSLPAL